MLNRTLDAILPIQFVPVVLNVFVILLPALPKSARHHQTNIQYAVDIAQQPHSMVDRAFVERPPLEEQTPCAPGPYRAAKMNSLPPLLISQLLHAR